MLRRFNARVSLWHACQQYVLRTQCKAINRTNTFVTSLIIGNFACAAGFTLVPGDVDGWGTLCGQKGAEKVCNCGECAAKCLACDGCRSYKCSVTELTCSLNSASKPSAGKNNINDAFCVKGLKNRGGACLYFL